MNQNLLSERLFLKSINLTDFEFIKELVNTKGWIKFIGERNIHSDEDARNYIQRIIDNHNVTYWVVNLRTNKKPIGIITFIKRDYLDFYDLGFAFLPEFKKNGYAFEASNLVLVEIELSKSHQFVLATTIPENTKSIKLLEKLGFSFDKKIENNNEILSIYSKTI